MAINAEIEEALAAPEPLQQLRSLVRRWQLRGQSQDAIVHQFEETRLALRESGRDGDEDTILDVMDFITGWCSPHARLDPKAVE